MGKTRFINEPYLSLSRRIILECSIYTKSGIYVLEFYLACVHDICAKNKQSCGGGPNPGNESSEALGFLCSTPHRFEKLSGVSEAREVSAVAHIV
jgi:hypothetical protein